MRQETTRRDKAQAANASSMMSISTSGNRMSGENFWSDIRTFSVYLTLPEEVKEEKDWGTSLLLVIRG